MTTRDLTDTGEAEKHTQGCCGSTASDMKKPAAAATDIQSTTESATETNAEKTATSSCCDTEDGASGGKKRFDWLLWGSFTGVAITYGLHVLGLEGSAPGWLQTMSHGVFELMNTMWWGVLAAALFVGLLSRIPQAMITAVLGQGGDLRGVWRATLAGVLMDLCSHGILMVGMQLYKRGASLGQVMAFLIASPWNSLSLTIILIALIGLPWTLAFIALSMVIAVISGCIFDRLVKRGTLPANPHTADLPEDYHLWSELKRSLSGVDWRPGLLLGIFWEGIKGSKMVLKWLLFGVLLATALRGFLSLDDFQTWFGPTTLGLVITLVAATIIEVCSEGSTPIAADLLTRASAPGNSFAFMMAGVSTDYTEVMVLKDTTSSWKIALFLPLVTLPQVVVISLILNGF
ncbi:permease [Pseudomaricurvus sp.]|uniref:permease n=1 Tax=Pseudomaricurvus sp. TaxID=2004510 RepID=UPI003F6B3ECA